MSSSASWNGKLLAVGFTEEAKYPRWVSNIVDIPKKNGKIIVCTNSTNLNKACLVHPYHMPRIFDLVDTTTGHKRMPFLDAFSRYSQIPLYELDRIHTSFVIDKGLYYYKVILLA